MLKFKTLKVKDLLKKWYEVNVKVVPNTLTKLLKILTLLSDWHSYHNFLFLFDPLTKYEKSELHTLLKKFHWI